MQERTRTRVMPSQGPGPSDDIFGDLGDGSNGQATVVHGTFVETLPVAQMTIAQVRRRFRDLMDIHPDANAVLDGVPVDDEAIVQQGQTLMFVRRAGEKGSWPAPAPRRPERPEQNGE